MSDSMNRFGGRRAFAVVGAVVGAAFVILVAGGAALLVWSGDDGDAESDVRTVAEGAAATTSSVPATGAPGRSLDEVYEACVLDAGFDPGGVQVLLSDAGRPEWVKTARDVPAGIHGPCFETIGGSRPEGSSHGNPQP